MIDVIYQKIARKDLSMWCVFIDKYRWDNSETPVYNKIVSIGSEYQWLTLTHYIPDYAEAHLYDIRTDFLLNEREHYRKTNKNEWELRYNIIWHPVMIWDVLQRWIENDKQWTRLIQPPVAWTFESKVVFMWSNMREPIENQSDKCIEFIYNLAL